MDFPDLPTGNVETSSTGWYERAQLVVDLQHLQLVEKALADWSVFHGSAKTSTPLELALLELTDLPGWVSRLRDNPTAAGVTVTDRLQEELHKPQGTVSDLDLVLVALRETFAERYGGWFPVLGKNRTIRGVEGLPEIGGGGEGDPEFEEPPPARAATPGGGRRVRIGILDTPIFPHPALQGKYIAEHDALLTDTPLDGQPWPVRSGHSTHVAGIILRWDPHAELMVHSVLSSQSANATAWHVATKMVEFADSDLDVLNMSFGCATDDGQPPLLLARAIERLAPKVVLVAAAGNHGGRRNKASRPGPPQLTEKTPYWPAADHRVWAVDARRGPKLASFSPRLPWVDLTAPGYKVSSTYLIGKVSIPDRQRAGPNKVQGFKGYARWSGTSFASASVCGEIGSLMRSGRTAREAVEEFRQRKSTGAGVWTRPYVQE